MNKPKIMAIMSVPRLGFNDFYGSSMVAFLENGVPVRLLYGVFWGQAMQSGMEWCQEQELDYIITSDYDTIFDTQDVKILVDAALANPQADAICALQMGRFSGLLASRKSGEIVHKEFEQDVVPIESGHFGLTIFKASALKDLPKPWFMSKPSSQGTWERGSDKVDEDIYFWQNWVKSGRNVNLASRVSVGHLELCIKWPDHHLEPSYQMVAHYNENGKAPDAWR